MKEIFFMIFLVGTISCSSSGKRSETKRNVASVISNIQFKVIITDFEKSSKEKKFIVPDSAKNWKVPMDLGNVSCNGEVGDPTRYAGIDYFGMTLTCSVKGEHQYMIQISCTGSGEGGEYDNSSLHIMKPKEINTKISILLHCNRR